MLLGILLGTESMIGYVIGLNLIGVPLILKSITLTYSLKNAESQATGKFFNKFINFID